MHNSLNEWVVMLLQQDVKESRWLDSMLLC